MIKVFLFDSKCTCYGYVVEYEWMLIIYQSVLSIVLIYSYAKNKFHDFFPFQMLISSSLLMMTDLAVAANMLKRM